MSVKRGSFHVNLVRWWNRSSGFNQDRFQGPVGPYLCFLWMKHEDRERILSKTSALKQESVIGMNQNTHMLNSQGYPSVIQEYDTEIHGRLGKLGCGNLGIWEEGFGIERAGMVICLCSCLTWMTRVCYWGKNLWRTLICTCACMPVLPACIVRQAWQ